MPLRSVSPRVALAALFILGAAPLSAQMTPGTPAPRADTAATAGAAVAAPAVVAPTPRAGAPAAPHRDAGVAGVRVVAPAAEGRPLAVPQQGSRGRGQALAIVGGAAFLGGLVIGDDAGTVIAIGGLGLGVYGLWLWLR